MNEAYLLDSALKAAGIPIVGVSIGDPTDRATWRVQLLDTATKEHEAAAQALIQSLDVSASAATDVTAKDHLRDPFTRVLIAFLAVHFKLTEDEVRDELLAGLKGQAKDVPTEPMPGIIASPIEG